jgi:predicted nucleic-acid-binding protein
MIGLDTNVLVRYLAQDDPPQSALAVEFIENACSEKRPAFINHIVLCETVWVLDRCYHVEKDTLAVILGKILKTEQFKIQNIDMVWRALKEFKKSAADFADCLLGQNNLGYGCEYTVTFDKKASASIGYQLLG